MKECWNTDISAGWEWTITVWRTRRHQWQITLTRDRVHRNGNHLWRVEFCRSTSPGNAGKFTPITKVTPEQ